MSIEAIFELSDHLRMSNWEFYFSNNSDIKYKVRSVTLPRFKLSHEALKNGLKQYVGVEHVDTVTIEFYEDARFTVDAFLQEMMNDVYDSERQVFRTREFGSTYPNGILVLYRGSGLPEEPVDDIARMYVLHQMKIIGIEESTFTYEDGSALIYSVAFAVESVTVDRI